MFPKGMREFILTFSTFLLGEKIYVCCDNNLKILSHPAYENTQIQKCHSVTLYVHCLSGINS